MEDQSEAQAMGILPRPRTSQPDYSVRNSMNFKGQGNPMGSGIGAGNVNAMLEKKYSYDMDIKQNILSRLNE